MNAEDALNNANRLIEDIEKLQKALDAGPVFKFVETDTIKAKFAALPIETTAVRFLVEVLEPVQLVPQIKQITLALSLNSGMTAPELLKKLLLKEWADNFKDVVTTNIPPWMLQVDKVDLIECDLLVPKAQ